MEKILFLTHTQLDGSLSKASLETLSAAQSLAKDLSADLCVGIWGLNAQAQLQAVGSCGASKFYAISGEEFTSARYSTDALAIESLVKASEATLILSPQTSRLSRSAGGAVVRLNGRIDTRITGFSGEGAGLRVQRWFYRQRMLSLQTRTQRPWFCLLESGVMNAFSGEAKHVMVEEVPVSVPEDLKRTAVTGTQLASSGPQTIRPEAKLLLVAGAGWTKKQKDGNLHVKEAEKLIVDFLEKTRASLGSSKSLVDQTTEGQEVISILSHVNQVGQTGASPRHPKGLSTCCHGEEPHVVGWRFVNERRAINLDMNCGWAQGKADVLYVGDAFQILEQVNKNSHETCVKLMLKVL